MPEILDASEIAAFCAASPMWRLEDGQFVTHLELDSFAAAMAFVNDVATAAEQADHHPDIDIRWRTVRMALSTHSVGAISDLDVGLARTISSLAAHHGANGNAVG